MLLRMIVLVLCMSCLCLWLGKLSVLVSADYVVQVEMLSYSNPSNTRSDGRCCDAGNGPCSGVERCDTYFIYCLILRASTATVCPNNELTTRNSVIWNGADINFSQPTVLGLPNPFKLTGISTAWEAEAQLYVQVFDFDSNSDDLIVQYRINPSPSVGSTITFSASSTTRPSITVNTTVLCATFYIGSSCDIFNRCESNAVTCSDRGTCTNDVDSYTCDCNAGYTGADCEYDIDDCEGQRCSGNGDCVDEVNSYICVCNAGYTGADCEVDIDDCVNVNCSGQGNCTDRVDGFNCDCFPGYTNAICQTDIDECDGIICSGNGGCVDMVNMFLCDCEPGYTGADCETNIDNCVNRNCSTEMRSDDATVTISGGVVGGLVGIVMTVVIVIVIVIIVKNKSSIYNVSGGGTADNDIPCQNNVVYGVCETNTAQPQTNTLPTGPPPSSLQELEYDYPLYNVPKPLPPVYGSVDEKNEKLMINVNVSYATVAEGENKLGQTSDIYDDVNMRQ